jgi:hypothetical protein
VDGIDEEDRLAVRGLDPDQPGASAPRRPLPPSPRRADGSVHRGGGAGDHELDGGPSVRDVGVEVLLSEEGGVVVHGDHRPPPWKAMPA